MGVRLKSLRYDAAHGRFEARVDVVRGGVTYRYPCRLAAPADAPRDWIEAALAEAALRQSDSGRVRPR
ncbi:orotidine 5'-phosphate decarboxylase [Rubellimicrobium sp. CFH 75288]|uniref:orotidine 5'-phosphate decarboxylase n=1 Tax=Rubellimicrobium sp. CFH 75288 TaxID=2697034 RepID=UPI00141354D9|nr:orotidine 5'-phosphate decarboxylase [Rubellimicrobium sp. CFH 75288]NAZ36324.1 orotidine 5'-phosphate decarboxylase [Rubellimicrobium sp. CFH 75288]